MNNDPRAMLDQSPMSPLQIAAVAVTVGLNALDGFDVLSISFASPGIAKEWGIAKDALGVVLSMELIGMAIGSVVLGNLADRIGRRTTILGCLLAMTCGMFMASHAQSVMSLSIWRVTTGLGIGGMLAATNAVAAEMSNARRRNLSLAIMVIGYPIGAVIGGMVVAPWLKVGDWRAVFEFGALMSALFIPLVWFLVPETIPYLVSKRPANALERINTTLRRFGREQLTSLSGSLQTNSRTAISELFKPGLMANTLVITIAYFAQITTFYYILKWAPKIVTEMGFDPGSAAGVVVWANVGGAIGGAVFGLLAQRIGLKPLMIGAALLSVILVSAFGRSDANLQHLAWAAGIAGFFTNAGMAGLYSIAARAFPTRTRATGTGFVVGVGRGGSVISPILAGFLFNAGYSVPLVSMVMAGGSLLAALVLLALKLPSNPDAA